MHLFTGLGIFAVLLQQTHGFGSRQQAHFESKSDSHLLARQSGDDTAGVQDGVFHQLIDHDNPSLGTFEQRYWYSLNYANGSSPPVVLIAPLDAEAEQVKFWLHDDYVIGGMIAKRIGAVMLMLENRYFGKSSPFQNLTTENMKFYTEDQIIRDKIHFAKTADLPFAKKDSARPDQVPWIQSGCSAQGNRVLFTEKEYPDVFWASWSSSAPPQAIPDFWRYFDAAKAYMPKNCTTDVGKVIDYLDNMMLQGSTDEIHKIKERFGASDLEHNDDFMNLLSYGPQTFQGASLRIHDTWQFCDYVENAVDTTDKSNLPGVEGVGLDKALAGYARWTKEIWIPGKCEQQGPWKGENNTGCFDFGDADSLVFANRKLDAPGIVDTLQLQWLFCNEPEEYWQTGSPEGTPTLVSRLVNKDFFRKTCARYFPPGPNGETYGLAKGKMVDSWNARYGGWSDPSAYLNRTILVNGVFDPWRAASFASPQRPGGILGNSTYVKHFLNPVGNHCTDTYRNAGDIWPEVRAIQEAGIDQIEEWVSAFPQPMGK
ncbi:hypothetical protein NW752_007477 [Fusarium irregulare]|uniref:Serine protease n=1 Tax=Fusarium irregulare TaxID=2494466 RepID=A0A9W8PLT7_9HYPO|nr:hypothetical protein NW766_007616 [Fusarium irregulare]KAJ4014706.1 hypothetical protein NW752_007477 [Fusarium irregulare]